MAEIQQEYKVQFYIRQFRGIFKKILVVYLMSIICLCYLFYKINTRIDPVYYAASENGKLKMLMAYNENQARDYIDSFTASN